MRITKQLTLTLVALATGCAASPASPGGEPPLVAVDDVVSQGGGYDMTMLAHGTTPTRGNQSMQLIVTTTAGAAVDGLTIDVVPWMPAMGHGTSLVPQVTALGSGVYEVDDLDLFMAGLWQLRTTFGQPADDAAPEVEVE